jgi:cholesterol oxidase
VLAAIAERQVANVIFIGGDDHLFSDATIRVRRTGRQEWTTLYALHASALYAPFPFANAKPADFRERDRFVFAWQGADYECEVAAFFHPQVVSGFIELEMTCDAAAWNVVATFRGADGTTVERRLAMAPHPKEPSPSPVPAGGD